jgi:lipoprotein-releasing system permease protein
MRIRVSIMLALRFLGIGSGKSVSNARKSLYGAIAGIGISLIPLVTVLVVSDGMIEGISSRIIELSTSHLRVADYSRTSDITSDSARLEALAEKIAAEDVTGKIIEAQPERQGLALAIGPKGRSGATIRAVQPSYFSENNSVHSLLTVSEGAASLDGSNDAVIGKKLASDIGVKAGDSFRLLTMKTGIDGNTIPRFTTFRVKAVVSSGYQELDALWVFIPLEKGFAILPEQSSETFISVRTKDAYASLDPVRNGIMRNLPDGFSVYTWQELNRSQFQSYNTTRTLLLFIMLLIVFIASVNVSSALVMLVMERRREIAILKSTGASPESISSAFLFAGFLTGLGGLIIGIPAGIFCSLHINGLFSAIEKIINAGNRLIYIAGGSIANNSVIPQEIHLLDPAYYLEKIPVRLDLAELFIIAAGTLVLSVVVSLLPAIRAGREKPLDTIRKF